MPDKPPTPHKNAPLLLPGIGVLLIAALMFLLFNSGATPRNDPGWVSGWKPVNSFHFPRRALATAVAGDYLYVVGGINDDDEYVKEVEFTRINPDGTLGEWQTTSSLLEGRFYLAAVTKNGYLYALGGATGPRGDDNQPIASVEKARIKPDGNLGPWQLENYLTTPRRGLKTVRYRNHIYAIGGYNGIFLKSVERAEIHPDGTLSGWQLEKEESVIDRYIHSAAILGDKIYLLGGHVRDPQKVSYGDVEMTSIGSNGALQPWRIEPTALQTPRFIATAFAMNNYIYMMGGHDGQFRLDSVEFAPIDASGQVGGWSFTSKMKTARSAAAVAIHKNAIYIVGGMDANRALDTVEMAVQGKGGHTASAAGTLIPAR
jgi:N-acetylneuraminic acid mutarotase